VSIDLSTPNPGRVYDYLLGGTHNFPADRKFGDEIKQLLPGYDVGAQRGRQCLCKAVEYLARSGYKYFIDFASGLPTRDNVHITVRAIQPDARIIYSDIDPLTMAYALEILGQTPHVRYIHCDAAEPEEMLSSSALVELFGSQRRVAITFMGISHFLSGATLRRALRVLYDWAASPSRLVVGFVAPRTSEITLATKRLLDVYDSTLHTTLHLRTPAEVIELAGQWRVCEPGMMPYDVYLGASDADQLCDPTIANIRGHIAFFEK
jgi:hypothetical protein